MARRPKDETVDGQLHDHRMSLFFTKAEIEAIDDYRFKHRIWSRSEAMRRLIEAGLAIKESA